MKYTLVSEYTAPVGEATKIEIDVRENLLTIWDTVLYVRYLALSKIDRLTIEGEVKKVEPQRFYNVTYSRIGATGSDRITATCKVSETNLKMMLDDGSKWKYIVISSELIKGE